MINRGMILGLLCLPATQLLAEDNVTKLVLTFDLLNRQALQTKNTVGGAGSKVSSTDVKSAKPGGLQVALFSKGWGLLASITPDTATTGLVGAGYEGLPGQYFGLAYNVNSVEYSDATPSSRSEFYGLLMYNIVPLAEGQKITALWTAGPTYTDTTQKLPDGSAAAARGQGTQFTLTLRYQYKLSDNLALNPALKIAQQSSRLKAAGVSIKRDITRYEIVPIAMQLRI